MREFPPAEQFRAWLEGLNPTTTVAQNWNCGNCPLANWLWRDDRRVSIVPRDKEDPGLWIVNDGSPRPLPAWAEAFVRRVDRLNGDSVTASQCLAILDEIGVAA